MEELIRSTNLSPSHAQTFAKCWKKEGPSYMKRLRNQVMESGPSTVTDSRWNVGMRMSGSATKEDLTTPHAIFQLDTKENESEPVMLELSHAQLYCFFQKLDEIQHQLDSVGRHAPLTE